MLSLYIYIIYINRIFVYVCNFVICVCMCYCVILFNYIEFYLKTKNVLLCVYYLKSIFTFLFHLSLRYHMRTNSAQTVNAQCAVSTKES